MSEQLGFTRGSFYYHFNSRQRLLIANLDYSIENWTLSIRSELGPLDLKPAIDAQGEMVDEFAREWNLK